MGGPEDLVILCIGSTCSRRQSHWAGIAATKMALSFESKSASFICACDLSAAAMIEEVVSN